MRLLTQIPMHLTEPSRQLQPFLDLLNQVFEIEKKAAKLEEGNSIDRNVRKIKALFEDSLPIGIGLVYHDPTGEAYDETRTDCEASIAGESAENLRIVEVIKPVIRAQQDGINRIIQRAVVVVESAPAPADAA